MSKAEDKIIKHSAPKRIRRRFQLKGFVLPLVVFLLLLALESCTAHYKYRRNKKIPCPCETEYRR